MNNATTQFVIETYRQPYGPARRAVAAVRPSADPFEKFIADLARRFTNSPEEAEAAQKEMNTDIERCGLSDTPQPTTEGRVVSGIALRRLIKSLQ